MATKPFPPKGAKKPFAAAPAKPAPFGKPKTGPKMNAGPKAPPMFKAGKK